MSRTKMILALLALLTAHSALAFTVGEERDLQARIAKARKEAELADAQSKIKDPALTGVKTIEAGKGGSLDIAFVAEYGVGTRLYGDFLFNGMLVTLSLREKNQFSGWSLESITPTVAVLVQKNSSGRVIQRKSLNLSEKTTSTTGTGSSAPHADAIPPATTVPAIRPVVPVK